MSDNCAKTAFQSCRTVFAVIFYLINKLFVINGFKMSRPKLSEGALKTIMQGGQVENPIMQVLGSKKIASNNSDKERYRILLSDGKYLISFAMFTTQINDSIGGGDLATFSLIKMKRYVTSVINNTNSSAKGEKRVLVILDVEVVVPGDEVGEKIGSPEPLPDDSEAEKPKTSSSNGVQSKPVIAGGSKPSPRTNGVDLNQTNFQDVLTQPIAVLSPYQNKWVIKARVTNKSSIRTWSNSKGEGKLFSMDLMDESGEIRATAFRDQVDKFYDMIEIDKVYYISKCILKVANKQYSSIKNDYEMTFTNDTIIQLCTEDADSIPQTQFNFVTIDKVAQAETGSLIDLIGVCKSVGELVTFQAKTTGRELKKKEVTLVDMSNTAIQLTLWGNDAENFDGSSNPVIALKGTKIGEFGGGKSVSLGVSTVMKVNPDIPEAHRLRGWFDNGGNNTEASNLSARTGGNFQTQWMNFRQVKEANLGNSERGDYYQVKATVLLLRSENMIYKACPSENCNKKVVDLENGMFRCEKCSREYPNFKYRLLGSMNIGDWSGNQWVSMFSSDAEKVLGMTAQEVGEAIEADPESLPEIANKANFKQFIFKCRAKFEMYNDENRLKTVVIKADNINYKEYNSYLISRINELLVV